LQFLIFTESGAQPCIAIPRILLYPFTYTGHISPLLQQQVPIVECYILHTVLSHGCTFSPMQSVFFSSSVINSQLHASVIKEPTTISLWSGFSGKVYDKVWSGPYNGIQPEPNMSETLSRPEMSSRVWSGSVRVRL